MTVAHPSPLFSSRILNCLRAPGASDQSHLIEDGDNYRCPETGEAFPVIDGIPSLFAPSPGEGKDVTERVRSFYEENPFPSYEGLEEFGELVSKGHDNSFSKNLLDAIGYNKTILECGCGTGQLSHYLQLNNNHVLGIDMSLASLGLAVEHKRRNALTRASFAQMNIFNLAIKDNSFDVVISHGVLHHTFDARRAFAAIVKKLKPGGIIMVGLYNRPARLPTLIRSKLIGLLGPNIDFVVRSRIRDKRKAAIWIADQYYNPHETWHSLDEVLAWFKENHVDYLNASPAILGTDGEDAGGLFNATSPGTRYQRTVTQLAWLGTIAREGALFDVIGKKADPDV
jgi:SAM-dependent methyltransferase